MKFKDTFSNFLKTLLVIGIFYSGLAYASYLFINPQDYQYTADDYPPYFFERTPNTNNFIKVTDTQNTFQFRTYKLESKIDMMTYKAKVKPTLLKWGEGIHPYDTQSHEASGLSKTIEQTIEEDLFDGSLENEIHVATYEGKIEAVSYATSADISAPEIKTLIANPEGLAVNQTTTVKGGGSALLDYTLQRYKARGIEKVQLLSTQDEYYLNRGWKVKSNANEACTVM
jgi:hypothetical protein